MKYVCHEDGLEFDDLERLQRHLKSKVSPPLSSLFLSLAKRAPCPCLRHPT